MIGALWRLKVFFAQITKVNHLPPASSQARCSVWSSDELMQT